jgi:S-(hydroxymethyl)glutathione dehydrogenase / alcohol dehydrogenase
VGGVGFFSILALKAMGFKKIIAIDNSNDKNRILKKMKIKHVLNNKKKDFNERINAISKNGVDVCYEATGTIQGIELGFSILNKKKGKLIFASHPISGKKIKLDPHELISGKTIAGTWGGNTNPDIDIKKYFKILDKSKINLKNFVKIYSFKNINKALIKAKENNIFRTIIKMSHLN